MLVALDLVMVRQNSIPIGEMKSTASSGTNGVEAQKTILQGI